MYGIDKEKEIREIRREAINANLKLVECPIRHLGTEEGYKIYSRLQEALAEKGVEMLFNTMVSEILVENGHVRGVVTDKGDTFLADEVVSAVGREGADWFKDKCAQIGIETTPGTVDIGVRVEVRDEVMQFLNENLYEAKLIFYTPTFDDKVRTFCTNPSGEVATEYYEGGLAVVNGHAYNPRIIKRVIRILHCLCPKISPNRSAHRLSMDVKLQNFPTCSAVVRFLCRPSVILKGAEGRRRRDCAGTT